MENNVNIDDLAAPPAFSPHVSMVAHATGTQTEPVIAQSAVTAIRSKYKRPVEAIRKRYQQELVNTGGDHKAAKKAVDPLKKKLPGIMWSGTFRGRGDNNLDQYSGLLCADLDHLDDQTIQQTLLKLRSDPHCFAAFRSPTDTGVKAVFRVAGDASQHQGNYLAVKAHVEKTYGLAVDESCKNVERLCFVSYDPVASFNNQTVPLDPLVPAQSVQEPKTVRDQSVPAPAAGDRHQIAERILGPIRWVSDVEGFLKCPGEHLHTSANDARDCRVMIDGSPTVDCFHQSCEGMLAGINHELRSQIGKAECNKNITNVVSSESADLPEATKPAASFVAYYDCGRKNYWIHNLRGDWVEVNETSLKRHLRANGLSTQIPKEANVSPVEQFLIDAQQRFDVAYAGPLAGYSSGVIEQCGNRILVTGGPKLIEPKEGNCPLIETLLQNLLGDQQDYFLGWLKVGVEALRAGQNRPGQAAAIAGPRNCGKSLVQAIITEVFGGRSAKSYRYMSEGTEFNGELFGAEHLMVEDDIASKDLRARRTFGARIKEITVNQVQSCHPKHRQAISLKPFWRLSITLNDEPENLMILPPIDESLADKIMLLKAAKREMPMPTGTLEDRTRFWNALVAELPAFLWNLQRWSIPERLRCERFGVTHYHHPELLAAIDGMSPEAKLLALVDAELFSSPMPTTWTGTAEQLEKALFNSGSAHAARRLLDWNNATGTYLGRLASTQAERITHKRTKTTRLWSITPPLVTA